MYLIAAMHFRCATPSTGDLAKQTGFVCLNMRVMLLLRRTCDSLSVSQLCNCEKHVELIAGPKFISIGYIEIMFAMCKP